MTCRFSFSIPILVPDSQMPELLSLPIVYFAGRPLTKVPARCSLELSRSHGNGVGRNGVGRFRRTGCTCVSVHMRGYGGARARGAQLRKAPRRDITVCSECRLQKAGPAPRRRRTRRSRSAPCAASALLAPPGPRPRMYTHVMRTHVTCLGVAFI